MQDREGVRLLRFIGAFVLVMIAGGIRAGSVQAQQPGWIRGVIEAEDGTALSGATVRLEASDRGVVSGEGGRFLIGPVPSGMYELVASQIGYREARRSVRIPAGDTAVVRVRLAARPVELAGIDVSVLRPDMQPESELEEREVREANPRDVGDVLRSMPGLDAVRRGPVGLDPVVRGLRETEVGVYLDGTRLFPGGAARMDSPLSHLDPSALANLQVVKGPYALTWGAGNMSAIRVETHPIPPAVPGPFHGRMLTGYDSNLNAAEASGSVFGRRDRLSYWLHGVWRNGDDYTAGDGSVVPADFLSREVRGKVGYEVVPDGHLILSAGYQDQRDMDYPGRLLNARYFETYNLSARWRLERPEGRLRSLEALAYVNDVDHGMDNDGKPTAEPDPHRMPPFPLRVEVRSGVNVRGGRLAAELASGGDWRLTLGGDVYRAHRNAIRTIGRRDRDMVMFEDLMWPEATITDLGLFTRVSRPLGDRVSTAAAVRLDLVHADADTASAFFLEHASPELDAREANLSGALTASARFHPNWSVSLGIGSVVRTADATERYSDRIPASKAQTSAEFMGTPRLEPERSTQADVWVEGSYSRVSIYLNAFARRMDNYITLAPTTLPKRLPLSPPTVFRYVNGEAVFWGADGSVVLAVTRPLTVTLGGGYLWGRDRTLDEPALGIAPLRGDVEIRFEPPEGRFFLEAAVQATAGQDRVAETRGEVPTDGYVKADVQGGVRLTEGALLRVGVNNLTDAQYVNHLNAKNPFTGRQIAEPGRVLFARLSYAF